MKKIIAEIIATIEKYNFWDCKVAPYGYLITVREFTKNWNDYDNFTKMSKEVLRAEIEGFKPILDHWVKEANEPKVMVKILTGEKVGKIKEVNRSFADILINAGLAKEVA